MSSAVSRIVIKSDRTNGRFPQLGQIVGVAGSQGLYVVMDVDPASREAQLMERSGKHRLVKVPFISIRTFNRKLAEAIRRLIDDHDEPKNEHE